jgi:hypothetical protein
VRELHVVAVSEDGRHVLLAGKRGATQGGFRVALDDRLTAAVRGDLPRPGDDHAPASELTPKQIQARLRAGETSEAIAMAAGVPVSRVERFSGPVQGEMARMIDAARSSYLVRGRRGRSAVPLGEAVDLALAGTPSLDADAVDWSTRREDDGSWVVTVTWYARKRSRSASWRYDPAVKALTATDPASAALGHHDLDAPVAPRPRPAARPTAQRAPAKKAPAKKAPAKKAPTKTVAKKAPAKKTTPNKVARTAAAKAPRKPATASAQPVRRTPPVTAKRALRVVPDPPPAARRKRAAAQRESRSSVPAWADVLLGTTPGGER